MLAVKVALFVLGVLLLVATIKLVSMILQDLANQRDFEAFIVRYNKSYTNGSDSDDTVEFYRRFRTFQVSV